MPQRNAFLGLAGLLAAITFWLYTPSLKHEFVNYDDTAYVTQNPHVQAGLTPASISWAFTTFDTGNWHPLTWLSHELDCQLYGLKPAGHHLTNIILHTANTLLLFALLLRMTGGLWRSAIVAAFFAWHPLRVESVAWLSERKDVLSTFFGFLAMLAYVSYVQSQKSTLPKTNRPGLYYVTALFCFAMSLLSKGMLVTLPCLLLLLDYWPLRRISNPGFQIPDSEAAGPKADYPKFSLRALMKEKIPFFLLSGAASVMTIIAQRAGGNVISNVPLPLKLRLETALYACFRYMEKSFYPTRLAAFYPYLASWPASVLLAAFVLIIALSVNAWQRRATHPYLIVGWLWYLGTLVPVIGLVQVGVQSMADRYTYIPSIGLLILVVWDVEDFTRQWRHKTLVLGATTTVAACFCLALTRAQEATWQNSETLFRQALKVTADNHIARTGLGLALCEQGRTNEAAEQYEAALRIYPPYYYAQLGLGSCRLAQRNWTEAAEHLRLAIQAYGYDPQPYDRLGIALENLGKTDEAAQAYNEALRLKPDWSVPMYQLAWLRATDPNPQLRDGAEALRLAQQAVRVNREEGMLVPGVLDAAYAANGRFPEAIEAAQKERDQALAQGRKPEAADAEKRLEYYRAGKPYIREAEVPISTGK